MSVIIKGIKAPKNCLVCPMQFAGWCVVSPPEIDERVAETVNEALKRKPYWCPLEEVLDEHD